MCVATPAQSNTASWRALEAAGFTRRSDCQPPDEPLGFIYALERTSLEGCPQPPVVQVIDGRPRGSFQSFAVVGSMILLTGVTMVAGKPLRSACSSMSATLSATQTQNVLSAVT